jgi:hypothetical protein
LLVLAILPLGSTTRYLLPRFSTCTGISIHLPRRDTIDLPPGGLPDHQTGVIVVDRAVAEPGLDDLSPDPLAFMLDPDFGYGLIFSAISTGLLPIGIFP